MFVDYVLNNLRKSFPNNRFQGIIMAKNSKVENILFINGRDSGIKIESPITENRNTRASDKVLYDIIKEEVERNLRGKR